MAELALVLDALDRTRPGPGDPLGQADRLHRGRRCQRIRQPGHARAGAVHWWRAAGTCSTGWPPCYPTLALIQGPLPGRRPGAGAGLPLSPRGGPGRRIAGAARGHAGHLPRLGRHAAAAAPDRRAGRAGHDAHRPGRRRARAAALGADARVPPRLLEAAARRCCPASRRARRAAAAWTNRWPLKAIVANRARKQIAAKDPLGHYPAAPAIVTLWEQHDGDASARPR